MADAQAPSPESLRLELQEAITTFRHQWAQFIQALGVIVTANSILLSYGFAQKLSSVLLVASLMPLAALAVYITIMTGLVPICYVATKLEQKLSLHDVPFIGIWARSRADIPVALSRFAHLEEDPEAQISKLKVPPWPFLGNLMSRSILAAFVLEVGLVVISIFRYHFRFM